MLTNVPHILLGIFLFLPIYLSSQNTQRCHHEEKMEQAFLLDPEYKKAVEKEDNKIITVPNIEVPQVVITIPVHVILVHPPGQAVGTGVNFSLAHVQSQIDVLNLDFRRLNPDAVNTPSTFPADDVEIEFCLASVDPNGNPTDGVTRFPSNLNLDDDEFAIKSATGWDRNTYMNCWVGDNLGGLLGWAYLPTTANLPNPTLDGIVVASCTFGGPGFGTCTPYALGRTSTHEVGHYLGLRHVWGNGGCANDDNIADTPIQNSSNFGCPNHPSPSCNNGGDMFMNYMDYVNDDCMNAFTTGQGTRMQNILNTSRSSLLTASGVACNFASAPLAISINSQTNVDCNGGNNGTITVQAIGGSGNYTYTLNGATPQSSNTFTNLIAGTYIMAVTDGSGSVSTQVTITEPAPLVPSIDSQIDVTCNGLANGSIVVSAMGGTNTSGTGYQFSVDNGPFTSNILFNNLSAGPHFLFMFDENNCESALQFFINEPDPLVSFVSTLIPIECSGTSNAVVIIESLGGTPPFLYSLNNGGFTNNNAFTNLTGGIYSLSTLDANECPHTFSFTIDQPVPIQASIASQSNSPCFGQNAGEIVITATGGSGVLQYLLGNESNNTGIFSNLSAGNYTVAILDENNCSETISFDITEPIEIVANIATQQNVNCFNENNGSIQIVAAGGSGSFQFSLGNENNITGIFNNLSAGNYLVGVLDGNNCSQTLNIEITEPNPISANISNQQNINCFGQNNGSVQIVAAGGTGTIQYTLGNETNTTGIFSNLSAGNFAIAIIDENNCVETLNIEITQANELSATISNQQNVNCFGENNGFVSIQASGGSGSNTFTLNGNSNTSGEFSNLQAGSYSVLIEDENNCTTTSQFTITQPTELNLSIQNITQASCSGQEGSVEVTANGGNGNYVYTLGTISNTTGIFVNLVGGNYNIQVTDANNCEEIINVIIEEPSSINASIMQVQAVSCFGENNGSAQINATGGTGNLQFTLGNEINNSGTFNNLSAGNYAIEISDENNCTQAINLEITQPSELVSTIINQQNANCFGENNGQAIIEALGGTGTITFTLNGNSNTTGEFYNLNAGVYTVQIEDENNCSTISEFNITQPTELILNIVNVSQASCSGQQGAIEVEAIGGNGIYTYALGSVSNTTGVFENLPGGNYNIQVTDNLGCTEDTNILIEEPSTINASIAQIQAVNCFGENNGSTQINASGGTGTLQFTIGNETNTTGEFNSLSAGNYSVEISDENNCTQILNLEITQPSELISTISNQQNINCFGENNGQILLEANGGNGSITFTLNGNSNTSGEFNNLEPGNYSVLIEDENNCSTTTEFIITEPIELNLNIVNISQASCSGSEGAITVEAIGGSGSYLFSLGNNSNTSGVFENLAGGNYNIQVTDNNNCIEDLDFLIEEPSTINASIVQIQSVNCFGENNGGTQINATGGTGTLQFTLGNEMNTTGEFNNLSAGNYMVEISDDNNCTQTLNLEITQPLELTSMISNQQSISCFGENDGQILLEANGGNGSITFTLDGNSNATGEFNNLGAGNYTVIIEDENNCSISSDIILTQPNELILTIDNVIQASCSGQEGTVEVSAIGGIGTYTFSLGNNSNNTGTFNGLSGGNYEIQVVDENGCSTSTLVDVNEPTSLNTSISNIQSVSCNGDSNGSVQINANGGVGNLSFTLGNETNSTGFFNNLYAGNYSIITSDDNNCTSTIDVTIEQPEAINFGMVNSSEVSCNDGSDGEINISGTGGTGDLIYTLGTQTNSTGIFEGLNAGTYTVMISDTNGCSSETDVTVGSPTQLVGQLVSVNHISCFGIKDGSVQLTANGGTADYTFSFGAFTNNTGTFENFPGGVFTFTITDNNGCITNVEVEILEPEPIIFDLPLSQNLICSGDQSGMIQVNATGGIGTLSYTLGSETNTTGIFNNLNEGVYSVTVIDENDCSETSEIEITSPSPIETTILNSNDVLCFDENSGSIQLEATGGTGLLEYTLGSDTNSDGNFENLEAGTYEVIVIDENNCSTNISFEISEPNQLTIELNELTAIDCNGNSSGSIQATSNGGTGNLTYFIGNATTPNTSGTFENLSAGTYMIEVVDENNCTTSSEITIDEPTEINFEILSNSPAGCAGVATGSISIQASNGVGNFTYSLNNITNTTGTFENLPSGVYDLVIEDENGCELLETITISEENDINIENSTTTNVNCFGFQDGEIHIDASSGSGDLTFDLNGMINNTGDFENLPAGNYNVIVSDVNNCSTILSFEITESTEINVETQDIVNVLCFGDVTGSVLLSASGGNENFTYQLNGTTNSSGFFEELPAGTYTAEITDDLGCTQTQDFEIVEPSLLDLTTSNLTPDYGNGEGSATLEGNGGTPPFTYSLDNINFQDLGTFANLAAGDYEGFVQDANGCISSTIFTIDFETSISNPTIGVNQIDVFPNPFSSQLIIDLDLANPQEIQLELWTVVGQNVSTKNLNLSSGTHQISIDSYSNLPAGSYFLQIKNNIGKVGFFKLIKQ